MTRFDHGNLHYELSHIDVVIQKKIGHLISVGIYTLSRIIESCNQSVGCQIPASSVSLAMFSIPCLPVSHVVNGPYVVQN